MALRKINGEGSHYFVPYGGNILRSQGYLFSLKNLTIGSFIERDKSRAALISIHAEKDNDPVNTVSVEYAIETTNRREYHGQRALSAERLTENSQARQPEPEDEHRCPVDQQTPPRHGSLIVMASVMVSFGRTLRDLQRQHFKPPP